MKTILYIHGMGGGADSRIPSILNDWFTEHHKDIQVAVRTYDFHPDRASEAIRSWYEELHPDLVIGESLGSVHALALHREPLLLVSPALNAPKFLYALRDAARIPAFRRLLNRIFKPREGQRQILDFSPETLTAWGSYRDCGSVGAPHAFFGRRDHYRRSGIVSLRQWRRRFGPASYTLYDGSHYMEEEHLAALLIPAILDRL